MGCSNPNPHGQIWAQESIPVELAKKQSKQKEYYQRNETTLLYSYLMKEVEKQERILFRNKYFTVLVPFWAVWPFETIIVPHRPMQQITEMNEYEMRDLAEAYKWVTVKYDNLFEVSFPYSAGIHQAPFDGLEYPEWHWHMLFYPPLLRSARVKKFMVWYEMLVNPQRDSTAEQAAYRLRALSDSHYKSRE